MGRTTRKREEAREAGRGAESHSLLRVSLPPPRQTSTPPHTRAPHEIHKPTGGTEIPEGGKIPSEIRRSKSLRPQGAALPRAHPESRKSPLKFPNPPRSPPPPPAAPRDRPASRRSRCRGFPPFVSFPRCCCRHELPRPARYRGPSRGREARGSFRGNPPLSSRGGDPPAPSLSRHPHALLVLEWRGGWRSTRAWIDSLSFGGFNTPARKINLQRCTSSFISPK